MKDQEQLINNIIGQLNGAKRMLREEKDCTEILTQLKASKSGINTIMNRLIEESSKDCLKDMNKKDRKKLASFFREIIKNN